MFDNIRIGSDVIVCRDKPVKEWVGTFKVLDIKGKICHLAVDGRQSQFSIDKVKLYLQCSKDTKESDSEKSPQQDASESQTSGGTGNAEMTTVQKPGVVFPEDVFAEIPTEPDSQSPLDDLDVVNRLTKRFY